MFRRMGSAAAEGGRLDFTFDGVALSGRVGDTVASALLAAGRTAFRRSPVSQRERGPLCMMGICHDCLVAIDGAASVQACLTPLRAGMSVSQPALPDTWDALSAEDK